MSYKSIGDYGVIGDMHSAALVGVDGSVDWLCFPRFDSPSVFAAILDAAKGGFFALRPAGHYRSDQHYLTDTNILCTSFTTENGEVELQDLMPLREEPKQSDHLLYRIVKGIDGHVDIECLFEPRLDYARGLNRLLITTGGVVSVHGGSRLALASPIPLRATELQAAATFRVRKGDEFVFGLQWGADQPPPTTGWQQKFEDTARYWRQVADSVNYQGRWRDVVRRSVLALHLLVYLPTGALVAAATTSLPEWVGGCRNWDYRYCWIRDTSFILDVLDRLGHKAETVRFLEWITQFCKPGGLLQTLYGVEYEEDLTESELGHLEGYRQSKPVRIGNAASEQFQLDIFGEVMVACATFHRAGGYINDRMWETIESFAEAVVDNWNRPDRGIWEIRGPQEHFVHSKVMCWLAMDCAITLATELERTIGLDRWKKVRDEIRNDILKHGWNEELQSFVQYYGANHTDAALLMLPLVGFIKADDPRMILTAQRIRQELDVGGLLRRYRPDHADDGIRSAEGVFTMCTLWLAGHLALAGELEEAHQLLERILAYGNHLGLFAEMVDPVTGEPLGNFPQAFTHVSLIHTIRNLDLALSRLEPPEVSEMRLGDSTRR